MKIMETHGKGKIKFSEDSSLKDMLNQLNQLYGQLTALKHITYSSLSLSDPESLVANVSLQIRECITDQRNAVWLKNKQGRFVKTALDGKSLPPGERWVIDAESLDFPDGIISGRMSVWDPSSLETPLKTGFGAPSFFPFKSDEGVTGFLAVDHVVSEQRDVYQFVAHYTGILLNISLLHQEVEKQKEELEEIIGLLMTQNEQMSSLHHVGIKIAIAPEPVAICRLITDTLVGELGAKNAAAFLLDEKKNELHCVAETGELTAGENLRLHADEQAPIKQSLVSGRIITRQNHPFPLDLGDNRLENWAVYPLKCKDRVVGTVIAETGDVEISDQGAILINHASIVIDTLMVLDKVSEEREQLADTLGSIGDGVIATDLQGRITLMNKVAENLTGWRLHETRGHYLNEVFCVVNEQTRKPIQDTLQATLERDYLPGPAYHILLVNRDGTSRPIVKSGTPIKDSRGRNIGTVIIFKDISDLRRLEQEFLKVQKLESLGVMAGGLAHDFNNLLNGILGNINLVQMRVPLDDAAARSLNLAEQSIDKAKDLTQKFLTFSSGGDPFKRKAVISHLLRDVVDLALIGSNVRCEFNLPDHLWLVEVDHEQMRQVLYNIVENAKEAMPRGGAVQISAENFIADETHLEAGPKIPEGKYVIIRVADHGVGIEQENLHTIFDGDRGMGLGLTIVHSVIRKHGGDIRVESRPGEGTNIHIYLPAIEEQTAVIQPSEPDDSPKVKKRVLFMDDEELLRDLAMQTLKALGYEASMAKNGEEAVLLYAEAMEKGQPFGAVVLDLTVPGGMGGKEALQKLKEIDPDVQAIVSSGYASDPIMSTYKNFGFVNALPKPYNIDKLQIVLKMVMP